MTRIMLVDKLIDKQPAPGKHLSAVGISLAFVLEIYAATPGNERAIQKLWFYSVQRNGYVIKTGVQ